MQEEIKRRQLPLKIRSDLRNDILSAQGDLLATIYPNTRDYPAPSSKLMEAEDFAEFIVRACNSHDELLNALKEAREVIDGDIDIDDNGNANTAMKLSLIFDAAIAKAEGK